MFCASAHAVSCEQLESEAPLRGAHIMGYQSGHTAVGKGRVQFYSGPTEKCKMPGVFILPGQTVNGYIRYRGFTSVMYLNPKTGEDTTGWVRSTRLQFNGTGIAPKQ